MANNAVILVTVRWQDFEGEQGTNRFWLSIDDGTTVANIQLAVDGFVALLAPLTNAALVGYSWCKTFFATKVIPARPSNEHYINMEEKLRIQEYTIDGHSDVLEIPAPVDLDLALDTETWAGVTATGPLKTWSDAWFLVDDTDGGEYVSDSDGVKLKEADYGYRIRRKSRKEKPGRTPAQG